MKEKHCNRCNINKDVTQYKKDKRWKYWVRSICKECDIIYHSSYYNKNQNHIKWLCLKYKTTDIWKQKQSENAKRRKVFINNTDDKTINIESKKNLLLIQDNKCKICLISIKIGNSKHLDHIIPLSRGWIHSIDNVQWFCPSCNIKKWDKLNYNI